MNTNTIRVLFIISNYRLNKHSKSVVKCRITYKKNEKNSQQEYL